MTAVKQLATKPFGLEAMQKQLERLVHSADMTAEEREDREKNFLLPCGRQAPKSGAASPLLVLSTRSNHKAQKNGRCGSIACASGGVALLLLGFRISEEAKQLQQTDRIIFF